MDYDTYSIIRGRPRHVQHQGPLRPVEGWALDALAKLDNADPGFLLHLFGSSPKWRQSVFLAVGIGSLPNAEEFLWRATGEQPIPLEPFEGLARALRAMTPRQIAEAALGEVPDGLGGCLAKLGFQPMRNAGDYLRLVQLLASTDSEMKLRAKALLQVDRLDSDLLAAALELDLIALHPSILRRVRDGLEARRVNARIRAIKLVCSDATDESLRQSMLDRAANFRSHDFAVHWLERADQPPPVCPALDQHPEFERVTPANAPGFGREFGNCLGSKAQNLVAGDWGAWLWRPGPYFVVITKCLEGDLLTGIYAPHNREVDRAHSGSIKDLLRSLGVLCFTRAEPPEELRPLTLGRFEDMDFHEFDVG